MLPAHGKQRITGSFRTSKSRGVTTAMPNAGGKASDHRAKAPDRSKTALYERIPRPESNSQSSQKPLPYRPRSRRLMSICAADTPPDLAHKRILDVVLPLAEPNALLVRIARVCLNGAVGVPGTRSRTRVIAMALLRTVLDSDPNCTDALLLKGEACLPHMHYGKSDPFTPRAVLQESFVLFGKAAQHGDALSVFYKGRWLLSMESLHKDPKQATLGRQCILEAAEKGCGRAFNYLAHRYENLHLDQSVSFRDTLPKGKRNMEAFIFNLYVRAAENDDADALNDIATSYAQGYASLPQDFDIAVTFYKLAIDNGCILAYGNLGTHYETGMDGKYPQRIDFYKALFYYREGAKKRCPKCAHNLGLAYEEGLEGVLQPNVKRAEKYYFYSLRLATDNNDATAGARTLRDLNALYMTKIKVNGPNSAEGVGAMQRLLAYAGNEDIVNRSMEKLNRAIGAARKSRSRMQQLGNVVGDRNAQLIMDHIKGIEMLLRQDRSASNLALLNHMLGIEEDDVVEPVLKRKRRSSASNSRKRRS